MSLVSRVSAEGRVVIPAEVRRAMALHEGDRVQFLVDDDGVRLVTPAMLRYRLWANNHGGDAGDSAADMRAVRDSDAQDECGWTPVEDDRSDDAILADLVTGLGLR